MHVAVRISETFLFLMFYLHFLTVSIIGNYFFYLNIVKKFGNMYLMFTCILYDFIHLNLFINLNFVKKFGKYVQSHRTKNLFAVNLHRKTDENQKEKLFCKVRL